MRRGIFLRTFKRSIVVLLPVIGMATPVLAQSSGPADTVTVSDTAIGAQGRISINAAAGTLNQQANAAVVAEGETALLGNFVVQDLTDNYTESNAELQSAAITGSAFAGAQGTIAVNVAAGLENQQANLAAIGIGIEGRIASLEILSQTRSSYEPLVELDEPLATKTAVIDPLAFVGASGLVQVNLTAGERNSSANLFALTLPGSSNQ